MNKILIIFFIIFFYGCTLPQENNSIDTVSNSGNIEKQEPEKQDIVEEQEELSNLTKKEVYEMVKDYDNSSKITGNKNIVSPYSTPYAIENREENEKIKDVNYIKNDPFLNQELKKFLKEIDLEFIYNLEELGGAEKLTQELCGKILNTLNILKFVDCSNGYIDIVLIDNKYIFLNLISKPYYTISYGAYLYDISNGNFIKFNEDENFYSNSYFFNNKLWFSSAFESIAAKFDLKNWDFYDYSGKNINKSNKWFLNIQDGNLIVEGILEDKKINLGKLDRDFSNDNFIYGINYFETNEDNTKFAIITNAYGEKSSRGSVSTGEATITYGNLENNGLDNSKSFTVNKESVDAQYVDLSNDTFYFIDDLIITTRGTIHSLELTVFDTNSEKFLYRSDSVGRDYFKDYE